MPASPAIAIIGMACRFPGASTLDEFWYVLENRVDTITRHPQPHNSSMVGLSPNGTELRPVTAYGCLNDIDLFDRRLFQMTRREAMLTDPQQRIWLECAWRALEDAGHGDSSGLLTGVFAGCNTSYYLERNIKCDAELAERLRRHSSSEVRQIMNGNDKDFLPLRTSYLLGLSGPSVNVQSACSTSLVAVADASRVLAMGEADLCIAGGASICRTTEETLYYEANAINSADGYCRPFDAAANGTVFGDGAGAVVLRRLDDAVTGGDRIYAVIRGWGVNNDGAGKASFMAPSSRAQCDAVRAAYRMADFNAASLSYVEAHGTGTLVGDPLEFEGLRQAYQGDAPPPGSCGIGSVKANIGHLDVAAGVAGLIKTALMLHRGKLTATLNYHQPNPLLRIDDSPFYVVAETADWPEHGNPRRAGVSSLGVGGTNCHVALEQAPNTPLTFSRRRIGPTVLAFSARSPEALRQYAEYHLDALRGSVFDLDDYCFSTSTGRKHFEHRKAAAVESIEELEASLRQTASRTHAGSGGSESFQTGSVPRLAFLFPGQLVSYKGMAEGLFESEPQYRRSILRCQDILQPHLDQRLTDILFADQAERLLAHTHYEQPALFAHQYALAKLWMYWGVTPDAVLGYSLGEYAAACVAGMASLEELIVLVAERGRLMERLGTQGAMMAVLASPAALDELLETIGPSICISAFPSPETCVISGDARVMKAAANWLETEGLTHRQISSRHAFHSAWVDPCLSDLLKAAARVTWQAPQYRFISSMTGQLETDGAVLPEYWRRQARDPVNFVDGVRSAHKLGIEVFLEVGPGSTLTDMVKAFPDLDASTGAFNSLSESCSDHAAIAVAAAGLYERGVMIDWDSFYTDRNLRRIDVPGYPFQQESFWFEPQGEKSASGPVGVHPLLGRRIEATDTAQIRYEALWDEHTPSYMNDHRLFGQVVAPASSHIAMLLLAVTSALRLEDFALQDLVFMRPVAIKSGGQVRIRLELDCSRRDPIRFKALYQDAAVQGPFQLFFTGEVHPQKTLVPPSPKAELNEDVLAQDYPRNMSGERFYQEVWAQDDGTGAAFRQIDRVWSRAGEALARARQPVPADSCPLPIDPGVIEACFQSLYAASSIETRADLTDRKETWVPYTIQSIRYRRAETGDHWWCRSQRRAQDYEQAGVVGDLHLLSAAGACALDISGFHLRPLSQHSLLGQDDKLYRPTLEPAPLDAVQTATINPGRWLVLTEDELPSRDLAKLLAVQLPDAAVIVMNYGSGFQDDGSPVWLRELRSVLTDDDEVYPAAKASLGLIYIGATSAPGADGQMSVITAANRSVSACRGLLELCNVLGDFSYRIDRIMICSTAQAAHSSCATAPLWGVARVMMNELAGLDIRLISLDVALSQDARLAHAVAETSVAAPGEQIYIRRQGRYRVILEKISLSTGVRETRFCDDRSYIIAGPPGDQLATCVQWMLEAGAGRVFVIIPDSMKPAATVLERLSAEERVVVRQGDLSNRSHCEMLLNTAASSGLKLGGILAIPWNMDDGVLEEQHWLRFVAAAAPVVTGIANLSHYSEAFDLDMFVCYSSSAAVLGSQGQASYAATCAFIDALCLERHARGLPAISINWGPWQSVGAWASLPAHQRKLTLDQGWQPIKTEQGLALTGRLIALSSPQVCVFPLTWRLLSKVNGATGIYVVKNRDEAVDTQVNKRSQNSQVRVTVAPSQDAYQAIRRLLSELLGEALTEADDDTALVALGLDSMMAIRLRNTLHSELSVDLSLGRILGATTIENLVELLLNRP